MSYLRTIQIPNGDYMVDFYIYKCDITGKELPENITIISIGENAHISEDGLIILLGKYLSKFDKNLYPYAIHTLFETYVKKRKRSTYLSANLRAEVLLKYRHTCQLCGSKTKLEIDHIIPVSKGGKNHLSNLQVLCKTCNIKKGAKL